MTFDGESTRSSTLVMKVLVLGFIIWVAYWAATGGLAEITPQTDDVSTHIASLL